MKSSYDNQVLNNTIDLLSINLWDNTVQIGNFTPLWIYKYKHKTLAIKTKEFLRRNFLEKS